MELISQLEQLLNLLPINQKIQLHLQDKLNLPHGQHPKKLQAHQLQQRLPHHSVSMIFQNVHIGSIPRNTRAKPQR